MKTLRAKIRNTDGSRAEPSHAPKELVKLARRISEGEYGNVTSVQVVIEAKGNEKPIVVGFGKDVGRDPAWVLWNGVKELHRISEPECELVGGEPVFGVKV